MESSRHCNKFLLSFFKKGGGSALFLLIFLACNVRSQPLDPKMRVYSPETYNAHNQVYCGALDPDGSVWFGTNQALLRYTGSDWEEYTLRPGMNAVSMDIDEQGRVWVGGAGDFGYMEVVPEDDEKRDSMKGKRFGDGAMRYVSLLKEVPQRHSNVEVIWDVRALNGKVFFNSNKALYMLDQKGIRVITPRNTFFRIYEQKGALWVQDLGKGLYRIDASIIEKVFSGQAHKDSSVHLLPEESRLPGLGAVEGSRVLQVLEEVPGMTQGRERIIVSFKKGIHRYQPPRKGKGKKGRGKASLKPVGKKWWATLERTVGYTASSLPSTKNPWGAAMVFSSQAGGVLLLDTLGRPVYQLNPEKGLPSKNVWKSFNGPKGSGAVWSTTNNGIVRWMPGDPRTYLKKGKVFEGSLNRIKECYGRIWVSSDQGVYFREKEGGGIDAGRWERIPGITGRTVGISCAEKGVLLGGSNEGLLRLRKGKGEWRKDTLITSYTNYLERVPLKNGRELLVSGGREGVSILDNKNGVWKTAVRISGIPGGVLYMQTELDKGKGGRDQLSIWCGSRTKGAWWIGLSTQELLQEYLQEAEKKIPFSELLKKKGPKGIRARHFKDEGLPPGEIYFYRMKGKVVVGTDSGLYRLRYTPRVERVKEDSGADFFVPDGSLGDRFDPRKPKGSKEKELFRLREGVGGSIWIQSGAHPLRLTSRSEGGYRRDSLAFLGMGLGTIRGIHPTKEGVTWMAGDKGLLRYDGTIKRNFARSYSARIDKVHLSLPKKKAGRRSEKEDSLLFGGFYRVSAAGDSFLPWKRGYEQPAERIPTLPYRLNALSFRFSASFYEEPQANKFSYKLEGFDENWSAWEKKAVKEYTSLPEGSYEFRVKARNIYGIESRVDRFRFRISPPWYRTWTAYTGYSIAGISFLWLLVWLNSQRLLAQKRKLERTVEERTQEIRKQKEKVEEQQKETEKQKEKVEEQKERVEEAHKEITQSIDYAQKIQFALLRSDEQIGSHLPDHFILFKPQSQVSGDFYWIKEHKGSFYIAAVDCTGHGVPGAFMSMLGISQLNEIMNTDAEPTPGAILTELRERVVRELSGSDPKSAAKDGMDAALVKIPISHSNSNSKGQKGGGHFVEQGEEEEVQVEFAGAQNPLYVIRKGIAEDPPSVSMEYHGGGREDHGGPDQDPRPFKPFKKTSHGIEIKGDAQPVGYDEYARNAFTTVNLQLRKGDMLYFFSDGYADQFGGPKGKKFRYGPFKQLLVKLHDSPLEEQKRKLDSAFEDWKRESNQEQIDDVVVIGVQL
ncbi:MAG: SpoIIE family protein phosphatase [Flavobacteriales bacterium]